jgi:hypothetical protein|tara:strand:- start:262 stop:615 length:354 start_codon:yes stop_codon:yes gene_type:complete
MAINYTWDVKKCDVFPTKSGKSNVVHNVHWRLKATDDSNNDSDGNPQTAEVYGSVGLDISDLSSFTNWSSLDEATVQSWVEAALEAEEADSVAAMKTGLDADIAKQITPTTLTKTLG